jgi:hypothetical protein
MKRLFVKENMNRYTVVLFWLSCLFYVVKPSISSAQHELETPVAKRTSRLRCMAQKQFSCTPSEGCIEQKASVYITINFLQHRYTRCHFGDICDEYNFLHKPFGIYTLVLIDRGGGAYFLVTNDGVEFSESISQGIWTISNFGICTDGK